MRAFPLALGLALVLALAPVLVPAQAAGEGWPLLPYAQVRPGVQAFSSVGQCTTNFVFTSPDNASVYVGLAAHCVDKVGDRVTFDRVDGGEAHGTVAYTSWAHTGTHDFSLVRVDDADRHLVHPAMLHFGGPIGLANSQTTSTGDKVISYGASGMRPVEGPASWKEGVLISRGQWTSTVWTATPGIWGDSGSGMMLGDGSAHSVVVTIAYVGAFNGVTNLDKALAYAKERGMDVRLATWPLLDDGLLPST